MTRRRTLAAIGWFVILWPLAQIALVEIACVNPWRLMGFAMYATEHDIVVTLTRERADGEPLVVEKTDLPVRAQDAYEAFVARRAVLGRLASPAAFVDEWRRGDPTLGRIAIDIEVRRLKGARMTTVARDRLAF